jgi:hypothetical protein
MSLPRTDSPLQVRVLLPRL